MFKNILNFDVFDFHGKGYEKQEKILICIGKSDIDLRKVNFFV